MTFRQFGGTRLLAFALISVCLIALAARSTSRGADENVDPTGGAIQYVLSRNGSVNEGRVVDRGNSYSIEFVGGGALTVSKLDVAFVGNDLSSVYRFKLSQTRTEDANEVLKLADWASRRGMAKDAIQTITERLARSTDEGERYAFERKLEELQTAERFRLDGERVKATKAASNTATSAQGPAVRGVGATEEERELDAWGRALLPSTLEKFSRKANPVLLKRCATSGCHDEFTRSGGYSLRGKALGAAQRLALLYNLRETTLYVNFDEVGESALLRHPTLTDPTGARQYPFGEDRYSARDYDNFLSWIGTLDKETKLAAVSKEYQASAEGTRRLRPGAASRYDFVGGSSGGNANAGIAGDTSSSGAVGSAGVAGSADSVGDGAGAGFAELFDRADAGNAGAGTAVDGVEGVANASGSNPDAPIFRQGISRDAAQFAPNPYDDVNSPESALRRAGYAPEKVYRDDFDPAIFNDRYHPQGK